MLASISLIVIFTVLILLGIAMIFGLATLVRLATPPGDELRGGNEEPATLSR